MAFDPKLKTPFEWSNKKRKAHDLPSSMQEIKRIREMWVDTANKVLAEYHLPLMDARSYKDHGLDQQTTIKMGVESTATERRGITTEKGNTNRAIKARNKLVAENHIKQEADNERRISALRKGLAWATEKNARLPGCIGDTKQRADFAKQLSGSSEPHITYCTEQIIERQFELTTQNDALKRQNQALLGQLNDAKTYQSDVMTQNKELMAQNKQLRESLKLSESQILKLTKQLSEVQDQPPTPSMTQHDEQELLDLISSKDELIEKLEEQLMKIREDLNVLNSLS